MRRIEHKGIDRPVAPDGWNDRMDSAALRAILSSLPDPIIVQDAEGRLVHASDAFVRMVGISSSDLIGKRWPDIGKQGEMTEAEALRKDVLRSGGVAHAELRSDGDRLFSLTIVPLAGKGGQCGDTVAIFRDITWQKEMERLREKDAILRQVIESVRDLVYFKDGDGRYILANASLRRLVGKGPGEVLGRSDLELLEDQEGAAALMENDQKVMRSGTGEMFEERLRLHDGARTFLSDKMPSYDGEGHVTGVIGISRDITERKRMEKAQIAKSKWLESILERAPVAIGVSRDGHTLYANSRYLRLFGFSDLEDIRGRPFIEQLVPEDRDRALALSNEHDDGISAKGEVELTGLRRDGSRFPFQAAIILADLPDGPALLGFFTDVTERRRLEKGLEESMRAIELYIDILTHDISNYNAAAIGYLQLIDMNLEPNGKEHRFISRSLQALADSSELIANIRDLQNIETGRDRPEPIDVCQILNEIKDVYQNPPDREVSILLTTHGVCMVCASRLLRGAFSNIISNAIKHSSGAVDIQITVSSQYRDGNDMVRVDIADNGPGIPYEKRGIIFDRSLMGLTKPVSRGLGLYLVKRLIESYDGKIWVEDRIPGDYMEGARFVVLLPVAK